MAASDTLNESDLEEIGSAYELNFTGWEVL